MKLSHLSDRMIVPGIIGLLFVAGVASADSTFDKLISEKKYNDAINYADENIDPAKRNASIWVKLGEAYENLSMPEKALACFLVSWRTNQKDYSSLLGAARAYNKLENSEMAFEMAKKALEVNFTAEASWEYARACIALKRPVEAKQAMAKVIEADSSNVIAVRELSNIYFSEGSWAEAVPLLKLSFKKNASGELAFQIGKAYTELGVADSALQYLQKTKEISGSSSTLWLMLGRAYYGKKKWSDCAASYKNAALEDLTARDCYRYGTAIEKMQGNDAAGEWYLRAVEKYGTAATEHESLLAREKVAVANISHSRFADAVTLLQQILAVDEGGKIVSQSYCLLADAYQGYNDTKNAIATLEKAIEVKSRNIEAYARLADLYQKQGLVEKAKKTYEVMIGLSPDDPAIYLVLGNYNLKSKRYKVALQQFEKSNKLKKSAAAQQGIARAAFELKNKDQAFSAAQASLKLDGKMRDARLVMASIQLERQQFTDAQENFEKLALEEPDNLELLLFLARCYEQNRQIDKLYTVDKKIARQKEGDTLSRLRLAQYAASKNAIDEALGYYRELLLLTPKAPDVLRKTALLSRKKGAISDASVFLKRYLDVTPGDAEAHRDYGDLLYEQKNFDRALDEYRAALKLDPAIKGFHKRYAEIVIAKGEQNEVVKALTSVIASGNADVSTYMTMGLIYQKKKEYANASKLYQEALKLEPSNFDALVALASCQAADHQYRDAIITYEQALMMNPDALTELKELGDLYEKEKRYDEALKIYLRYCEKDSGNPVVTAKVGKSLYDKNDYKGAVRYYAFAGSKLEPADAVRYASACLKTGESGKTIEVLGPLKTNRAITGDLQKKIFRLIAEAFEMDSNFVTASTAYGDFLRLQGVDDIDAAYKQAALLEKSDPVAALKIFELNRKKYPSDYRNYLRLAYLYSERKDMLSKAIPLFKRVTELADSVPVVWFELGSIYGKIGDDAEELAAYRKYTEADPQNTEVNRRIGTILLRKGQVNEGIVFLEIANTLQPDNPDIMAALASGYLRTNRIGEAVSLLQKAKAKKADDPEIRFQLFQIYQKNGEKDKAQKEIEELLHINREPRYMIFYAEALVIQGKLDDAENVLEELLENDPENMKVLLLKGRVLRLQKQYDEAVELYKEMNLIDPESALPLFERAETHFEQAKPQWAETFYKRALRADPTLARAELGLAKIAKMRKDMIGYREHLENARRLGPDNEVVIDELKKVGTN